MLDQFSETVGTIYAAATGVESWEDALNAIEHATGSVGAVIGFIPRDEDHAPFNLAGRFTAEQCAIYTNNYQSICRRTRYMMDHADKEVIYDSLLIDEREMDRDPVYDWFRQHDLRYFVGSSLPSLRSHHVVWSLQRSPAQGHVQQPDIRLFKQIRGHLSRALILADRLETMWSFRQVGESLLQSLPQPVFGLAANGRVLFTNEAGADFLRQGRGLAVQDNRLRTHLSDDQARLDQLIVEASNVGVGISVGSGWTSISRPNGPLPLAVFVAPLRNSDLGQLGSVAEVLVVVHDPCARRGVQHSTLTRLYGLTDTEAKLAAAIGQGHSLDSAAATLGMRVATARSHLKSIFVKLEVNRQQDLVRLLMSLSSLHS